MKKILATDLLWMILLISVWAIYLRDSRYFYKKNASEVRKEKMEQYWENVKSSSELRWKMAEMYVEELTIMNSFAYSSGKDTQFKNHPGDLLRQGPIDPPTGYLQDSVQKGPVLPRKKS